MDNTTLCVYCPTESDVDEYVAKTSRKVRSVIKRRVIIGGERSCRIYKHVVSNSICICLIPVLNVAVVKSLYSFGM